MLDFDSPLRAPRILPSGQYYNELRICNVSKNSIVSISSPGRHQRDPIDLVSVTYNTGRIKVDGKIMNNKKYDLKALISNQPFPNSIECGTELFVKGFYFSPNTASREAVYYISPHISTNQKELGLGFNVEHKPFSVAFSYLTKLNSKSTSALILKHADKWVYLSQGNTDIEYGAGCKMGNYGLAVKSNLAGTATHVSMQYKRLGGLSFKTQHGTTSASLWFNAMKNQRRIQGTIGTDTSFTIHLTRLITNKFRVKLYSAGDLRLSDSPRFGMTLEYKPARKTVKRNI